MTRNLLLLLAILFLATTPVVAEEESSSDDAYRISGYASLAGLNPGRLEENGPFVVGAGFERATVGNLFAGAEFRQQFGLEAFSTIVSTARYYFRRGGQVEVFAIGRYASQVDEADSAEAGGGVNIFGLPRLPASLGVQFQLGDEVDLNTGGQSAAVRAGLVWRF